MRGSIKSFGYRKCETRELLGFGSRSRDGEEGGFRRQLGETLTGSFIRAWRMFHASVPSSKTEVIQQQPVGQIPLQDVFL